MTTDEDRAKIQQYMREVAEQVLRQEQAEPGQDPELITWANNKLAGTETPLPASAPQAAHDAMAGYQQPPQSVQPPVPSQPPLPPANPAQQAEPEIAEDGSEGVLHIQRTPGQTPGETIHPTQSGETATNDTQDNGERNGNSN